MSETDVAQSPEDTELQRALQQNAVLRQERDHVAYLLLETEQRLAVAVANYSDKNQVARLKRKVAGLEREITAMRATRSWRVTRRLRTLGTSKPKE